MKKRILLLILLLAFITCGCGKKEDKVVIYSSMEENRNQALKKQIKEKFPDLDIVVQYMSTGNSAAKLKTEGSSTEADIVLDLELSHVKKLQDNFADISSINTDIYLDEVENTDKYIIWAKNTMNLIVDAKYFKEHKLEVPKTYEDLLKPEYKNLIAMPDPKTSGTGYSFYQNVVNIMGEAETISYFKKLKNNLREFTTSGSGPTNLLKQGEIAIALGMTSQGAEAINEGYDFKIIELSTGSPYNLTASAVIKGHDTKNNVMRVYDWLINTYGVYDKENFMPDKLLKNQTVKVKNYPTSLKNADMTGTDSSEIKEKLIELWDEVNG